jgi:hypothetical protein
VNFSDLLTLAQNYNQSGKDWAHGDLTYDGTVGFADLLILAQQYGQSSAAAEMLEVDGGDSLNLLNPLYKSRRRT